MKSKINYLSALLSSTDFGDCKVLDAGTGRTSSKLLLQQKPKELICVSKPGDKRKGKPVQEILDSSGNKNYRFLYGDLANLELFLPSSFDYILVDYLLGEASAEKISCIFQNFNHWLKVDGKIVLIDREYYHSYQPEIEYISMSKIQGNFDFTKLSCRDFIEILTLFLTIPSQINFLTKSERSFDFPSNWVYLWLVGADFKDIQCNIFESPIILLEKFESILELTKNRIDQMQNKEISKGLLSEIKFLVQEFRKRNFAKKETFPRKHYCFQAYKR